MPSRSLASRLARRLPVLSPVLQRLDGAEAARAKAEARALTAEQRSAFLERELERRNAEMLRRLDEAGQVGLRQAKATEASLSRLDEAHVAGANHLTTAEAWVNLLLARFEDARAERAALQEALTAQILASRSLQEAGFRRLAMPRGAAGAAAGLYLDLLESALTGTLTGDGAVSPWSQGRHDPAARDLGRDWPSTAQTMIGTARMRNLRMLLERALAEEVPGDFIETGVWRGGACIYARAILEAHGDTSRRVFVADSFRGLPPPDEAAFPADAGDLHHTFEPLAVSRQQVEENFRRYRLLDERVVFLEGWFKDTLPTAPIERLAVLRLDGDMYESTIEALDALGHKVSPGGFVIVDDYLLPPCAQAVHDYRARHGITAELHPVDGAAVWWQVPRG